MSQINFFMDEKDDAEFFDMILGRGDTSFIIGRFSPTDVPVINNELPQFGDKLELHLVNSVITPKPRCSLKTEDGMWLFDSFRDVHIELQRSHVDNCNLVPGRIYAKIGWSTDEQSNKAFQCWYSSIERWLKRRYSRADSVFWIGPSAKRWSQSGGLLSFGPVGSMTRSLV